MENVFKEAYHYKIESDDQTFNLFLNEDLLGSIFKPANGRWPILLEVRNRNYLVTRKSFFSSRLLVRDAENDHLVGTIELPFFSTASPKATLSFLTGKEYGWVAKSFFSYHWQWWHNRTDIINGIQHFDTKRVSGVITVHQSPDEETRLLILMGMFLSLLRRSHISLGIRGLKLPFRSVEMLQAC